MAEMFTDGPQIMKFGYASNTNQTSADGSGLASFPTYPGSSAILLCISI